MVTGAATGIGAELAVSLAEAGARVLAADRSGVIGRSPAGDFGGGSVERLAGRDLADLAAVDALADEAAERCGGRLHGLVNNAAVPAAGPVGALDPAALELAWRVNALAPMRLTDRLLPALLRSVPDGGASVVNVTSIHDAQPFPGLCGYAVSKAALAMFTKSAAVELGPRGVRVNSLAPGAVETPRTAPDLDRIGRGRLAAWIPLGRVAAPADLLGPLLLLLSDAGRYLNGTTLYADGGHLQRLVQYDLPLRLPEDA